MCGVIRTNFNCSYILVHVPNLKLNPTLLVKKAIGALIHGKEPEWTGQDAPVITHVLVQHRDRLP